MTYIIYGAVGVIAVLLLFAGGVFAGWKLHVAYEKHNHKVVTESVSEEEKREFLAQQKAFDNMLHYNVNQAYGLTDPLYELQNRE